MFSLSDRLKAAVNNLEATGAQLQARATGQQQIKTSSPASPTTSSSAVGADASRSSPASSANPPSLSSITSPTRNSGALSPSTSTSQLAENALSGLRKSFNFARDGPSRPSSAAPPSPTISRAGVGGEESGAKELKDIVAPNPSKTASLSLSSSSSSSRPSSPSPSAARFNATTSANVPNSSSASFAVGSDPSTMANTPRARSPVIPPSGLTKSPLIPRPSSPNPALPPPDPSDPSSYPLPLSPTLSPALLSAPPPSSTTTHGVYMDPLGASPVLATVDEIEPPSLELQSPTPVAEKSEESGGLGITVNGDHAANDTDGSSEVDKAGGGRSSEERPRLSQDTVSPEDNSAAYGKLRKHVEEANAVLRELTPLEGGIEDAGALEGWVRMMNGKVEMISDEMKRLQDKIALQDSRMEEVRDTHRLESTSQSELVTKLRSQLSTAESNLASRANELMTMGQLRADLTKAQTQAKEEEEKRTKAVSLLKTVRMKLVKAEKDKEEVERDRAEERAERSRAAEELERIKAERERDINALRKGFERELAGAKDRYEKDVQAKKAAWELEMITTKAAHAKEISGKSTKVAGLELIVKELNNTKQHQFESLESKQAEVETSRAEMETLQNRTKELDFQLREASERCTMLEEQASVAASPVRGRHLGAGLNLNLDGRSARSTPDPSPSRQNSYSSTSAAELQRVLAEAEARSEAKLSDLRFKIRSLENERNELEEDWANKLQERVRELEKLRRVITEKESEYSDSLKSKRDKDEQIASVQDQKKALERELASMRAKVEEVRGDVTVSADAERSARNEILSLTSQISALQSQLDDAKNLSTQLRTSNKTLRDELRKVQSSVQLMERSRNPGVGYWSSANNNANASGSGSGPASVGGVVPSQSNASIRSGMTTPGSEIVGNPHAMTTPTNEKDPRKSLESVDRNGTMASSSSSGVKSPAPSDANKDEEEVNLEYLRNVILQFLENKEMRPNLVRVLSVILRFTPQELRRLNAKLLT